jgi:hypothetical protein
MATTTSTTPINLGEEKHIAWIVPKLETGESMIPRKEITDHPSTIQSNTMTSTDLRNNISSVHSSYDCSSISKATTLYFD